MSTGPITVAERQIGVRQLVADYIELTKPKIAVLLLVCVAISGFWGSNGDPNLLMLVHVVIGTALVAASSCVWNQCIEAQADRNMPRTCNRPIPSGRMSCLSCAMFGTALGAIGLTYLFMIVGFWPAFIGAVTWLLYVCVYTPLKQKTPWNTTVGAVAGALPMLMGWFAVNSTLTLQAVALFAILFFWQFPHFMAIAWLYREDYAKGGMRMWTVVDQSGRKAGMQAVAGAMALLLVSLIPGISILTVGHVSYMLVSFVMGVLMLFAALRFCFLRNDRSARQLLFASLFYLPLQLGMLFFISPTV